MARAFLFVLALISAVLGYLMDNVWLLGAAGALFLLALLVLLVLAVKRRRRRSAQEQRAAAAASREAELSALGISDIRPRTSPRPPAPEPRPAAPEPEPAWDEPEDAAPPAPAEPEPAWEDDVEEEVSGGAAVTPEDGPLPERAPEPAEGFSVEARPSLAFDGQEEAAFWRDLSPTAVKSLLRALWAAAEVQTIALFRKEGAEFDLLITHSHIPSALHESRTPAAGHFLSAVSAERPLTVLEEGDPLLRKLPYYRKALHVGPVAVVPVQGQTPPVFLVADLPADQPAFSERQRTLLLRYADLLGAMLTLPAEEPSARAVPTRRSIIQDEMTRARVEGRPLALALVYRTDAEDFTERGPDAVAAAERELRLLLEDVSGGGRVERFGELMYGVFLHDADADAIEGWADRAHARADAAHTPVAMGIARLGDRHADADALRADAANALQEAVLGREPVVIG